MSTLRNSVQLLGRLGKEAIVKMSSNGKPYCYLNLVTNEYVMKKNGEHFEKSQWHTIGVWGEMTEKLKNKGKKGSLWLIQGTIEYRQYADINGELKNFCEIKANKIMFLTDSLGTKKPLEHQVEL